MNFENYVLDGRFANDAERFGISSDGEPGVAMPPESFTSRLPESARRTLAHIVEALHANTFPSLYEFRVTPHAWGFDFAAKGLEVRGDDFEGDLSADVFSLATDSSGNHHCLHADGRVVIWNHEESNLEGHTQFPSLDEALYAWLHREAVGDDLSRYEGEIQEVFTAKAGDAENGWSFLRDEIDELIADQ